MILHLLKKSLKPIKTSPDITIIALDIYSFYVIIFYGDKMKSVKSKTVHIQELKKSRFIGIIQPAYSEDDTARILEAAKAEYPGASHYTYAYILGESGLIQKASDDKEPTRTAGYPILEVLMKNDLTDVIAVVIRYFGGTKLGKGGLIRAYSSTISEAVKNAVLTEKMTVYECAVTCAYDNVGAIDRIIREQTLLQEVNYDKVITFRFTTDEKKLPVIREQLFNKNNFEDRLVIIAEQTKYV